jgi:CDGSH-type Zn-finger protein
MSAVKIIVRKNGPYRVEAPGGSVTKPFCDGTHSRIGFQGAELAVKKAENG